MPRALNRILVYGALILWTIVALADHNLGGVLAALGRLEEARAVEHSAAEAFRASGDPRLEGSSRVYLSRILLAAGDVAGAEADARWMLDAPGAAGQEVAAGGHEILSCADAHGAP